MTACSHDSVVKYDTKTRAKARNEYHNFSKWTDEDAVKTVIKHTAFVAVDIWLAFYCWRTFNVTNCLNWYAWENIFRAFARARFHSVRRSRCVRLTQTMKFFLSVQKLRFLCLAISVILVESHFLIHLLTDDIPETSVSLDRESAVGNFCRRQVANIPGKMML